MEDQAEKTWRHFATWGSPTLIAVIVLVVGFVALWAGFEMIALLVTIAIGALSILALLWITDLRLWARILLSLLLIFGTGISWHWVAKQDRPVFDLEIGSLITQNYRNDGLALDVETLVKNVGRQSAYADRWRLELVIDGTSTEGRELYGEVLPAKLANEPQISDAEFPPGKPVRGWLTFGFPSISHDYAEQYFTCGSPMMDKLKIRLSVWDSKMKHEWSQEKQLRDLSGQLCSPIEPSLPKNPSALSPLPHPKPSVPTSVNPDINLAPAVHQPICTPANGYCEQLTNSDLKAATLAFGKELKQWGKKESAAYNEAEDQAGFDQKRQDSFHDNYERDARQLWALLAEKITSPPPCLNVPVSTESSQFANGARNINDLHREEHLAAWLECYANTLKLQ